MIVFPEVEITQVSFMQNEDTSGRVNFEVQRLDVEFIDSGNGYYAVLQTDRWAIDKEEMVLATLRTFCNDVIAHNDKVLTQK